MGLIQNYKTLRAAAYAAGYKPMAASGKSSGVKNFAKNNKMSQMVARNPGKSAMLGGAALGGIALGRTRKSGLDKTPGRPTGMYGY
jgi:hypothetical protein